jgi:hypothetical protein
MLPFSTGIFEGRGHWINQQAEGDYTARYEISEGADGSIVHAVRREFLTPDGSTLYAEETTVSFTPGPRNGMTVVITGPKGSVTGSGYCFGNQCHYDADVSPGTRLEFTFTVAGGQIDGLASSANKENFTSWRETLYVVAWGQTAQAEEPILGSSG